MSLSLKLKFYRKHAGLSQIKLAEKLGISIATLRRWEAGETSPNAAKISELAEVLNIPAYALMVENEAKNINTGKIVFENDGYHLEFPDSEKGYEILNRLLLHFFNT